METLVWGWDHMPKAIIFGKLMDLANPIVNRYRSDFFHDAMWISELPDQPVVFFYAISDNGTYIFPNGSERAINGYDTFRITVTHTSDNKWEFGAEKVYYPHTLLVT